MPFHLLDTNILLRLSDAGDPQHSLIDAAVNSLTQSGNQPVAVHPQSVVPQRP